MMAENTNIYVYVYKCIYVNEYVFHLSRIKLNDWRHLGVNTRYGVK